MKVHERMMAHTLMGVVMLVAYIPSVLMGQQTDERSRTGDPARRGLAVQALTDERLWFETQPDVDAPSVLEHRISTPEPKDLWTPRERWLQRKLLESVASPLRIDVVEVTKVRLTADGSEHERRRGLEIAGAPEAIAAARAILDQWNAVKNRNISVRIRLVDTGEVHLEPPSIDANFIVMKRDQLEARRSALRDRGVGEVLNSSTIAVLNGFRGLVSSTKEEVYVKDYDIKSIGELTIVDPLVGTIADGIEVEVLPILDLDGKSLTLRTKAIVASLARPIRQLTTTLGGFPNPVTLQLPEVRYSQWSSKEILFEPGEDVLVVSGLKRVIADDESGSGRASNIEFWFEAEVKDAPVSNGRTGEILAIDEQSQVLFVRWSESVVRDDPAKEAPQNVQVVRVGAEVGTARLEGGWNLPMPSGEERWRLIAIYRLTDGEARVGDRVR